MRTQDVARFVPEAAPSSSLDNVSTSFYVHMLYDPGNPDSL